MDYFHNAIMAFLELEIFDYLSVDRQKSSDFIHLICA